MVLTYKNLSRLNSYKLMNRVQQLTIHRLLKMKAINDVRNRSHKNYFK